jgi:RimJ/RimL family protein N-acetyltransferase
MKNLLTGNNVKLTAIMDKDIEVIIEWFNDTSFLRTYDIFPAIPQNLNQIHELMDYYTKSSERVLFAIRDRESEKIIGLTGFDDILWNNGTAAFFIGIGDNQFKGKGLGKEAAKMALDFGFYELNLHRIQLNVISYNEPGIRLYESLGFTREGCAREAVKRDGKRSDLYLYGILSAEWNS